MLFRSDRKSTRLNSSHTIISYAVFCLKKKKINSERRGCPGGFRGGRAWRVSRLCWRPRASLFVTGRLDNRQCSSFILVFFFFNDPAPPEIYPLSLPDALPINDTATTEIYTLSLHDALPISVVAVS